MDESNKMIIFFKRVHHLIEVFDQKNNNIGTNDTKLFFIYQ